MSKRRLFNTSKCLRVILDLSSFLKAFCVWKGTTWQCWFTTWTLDEELSKSVSRLSAIKQNMNLSMRTKQWNQCRWNLLTVCSSTNTMCLTGLWFPNILENLKIPLCGQVVKIHTSVNWKVYEKNVTFLKWIKYFNGLETKKLRFRVRPFFMKDSSTKWRPQENAASAIFFGENISRDVFTSYCKLPWSMECCTEDWISFILTMCAPQLVTECITDAQQIFWTELILTEQKNTESISSLARIIICESS